MRQFTKLTGEFAAQCASCGLSGNANEFYADSDKSSQKYKAHYCSACACMLVIAAKDADKRVRKNEARRARHAAYTACGLKRVKGALGGTYYE